MNTLINQSVVKKLVDTMTSSSTPFAIALEAHGVFTAQGAQLAYEGYAAWHPFARVLLKLLEIPQERWSEVVMLYFDTDTESAEVGVYQSKCMRLSEAIGLLKKDTQYINTLPIDRIHQTAHNDIFVYIDQVSFFLMHAWRHRASLLQRLDGRSIASLSYMNERDAMNWNAFTAAVVSL